MTSLSASCSDRELLECCNESELYQNCRRLGLTIPPHTPKDKLIDYLLGEDTPPAELHPIDEWRHAIMGFLIDHWPVVFSQLQCPAKSKDPRACFTCVDPQVINCVVQNKTNERLIAKHRLPRNRPIAPSSSEGEFMETLTPQNAPRDPAILAKAGTYKLRKLAELIPFNNTNLLADPTHRSAFINGRADQMAEVILAILRAGDGQTQAAPQQVPQQVMQPQVSLPTTNGTQQLPAPPQSVMGPPMGPPPMGTQLVVPGTGQAEQAPAATGRKRNPPQQSAPAVDFSEIKAAIETNSAAINALATTVMATKEAATSGAQVNNQIVQVLASLSQTQQLTLSLLLMLAENNLGASQGELAKDAQENVKMFSEIFSGGKAG